MDSDCESIGFNFIIDSSRNGQLGSCLECLLYSFSQLLCRILLLSWCRTGNGLTLSDRQTQDGVQRSTHGRNVLNIVQLRKNGSLSRLDGSSSLRLAKQSLQLHVHVLPILICGDSHSRNACNQLSIDASLLVPLSLSH